MQSTHGPIEDLQIPDGERMALLKWSKKYSVNVNLLDDQHAEFVRAMNEIHAAMLSGRGQDVTAPMLDRLLKLGRQYVRRGGGRIAGNSFAVWNAGVAAGRGGSLLPGWRGVVEREEDGFGLKFGSGFVPSEKKS